MTKVDRYSREASFLRKKPETAKPIGAGIVKFKAKVNDGDASNNVLNKIKSVISIIDETSMLGNWPEDSVWIGRLPKWFVSSCAAPMTEQQANSWIIKWKKMSDKEKAESESKKIWSIDNWIYWMRPENRQWFWWDSEILDDKHFLLAVEVEVWPFPWGSLQWLVRASGAPELNSVEVKH